MAYDDGSCIAGSRKDCEESQACKLKGECDLSSNAPILQAGLHCVNAGGGENSASGSASAAPTAPTVTAPAPAAPTPTVDAKDEGELAVALQIPTEFTKVGGRETDLGYNETYQSPGIARLNISKGHLSPAKPSLDAMWQQAIEPLPGMRVTFKKKGLGWFATSGFIGELIFYSKVIVSGERWAQFTMTFSQEERRTYDPLLGPMEKSFHFVTGNTPTGAP